MSYVPPHKRHSSGSTHKKPAPEKLAPLFGKKLNLGPSRPYVHRNRKYLYSDTAKHRWFAVSLENDDGKLPPCVSLQPVTVEAIQRRGEKPLALVNSCCSPDKGGSVRQGGLKKPWMLIAERVMQDLLPSFEKVRSEIESGTLEDIRPALVARIGKVLFLGNKNYKPREEPMNDLVSEECLTRMRKMFYTSVPASFSEKIVNTVIPNINFKFEKIKDMYVVEVYDESRPDDIIFCNCRVIKEDNSLELYKMQLSQIRQMVCDISCLDPSFDLRVMLCSKRIMIAPTEQEEEMINKLVKCAIIDANVKGGLKWPLGKESCGDRYRVVGVWHTNYKTYSNPLMKLNVRDADRFDFRKSVGEVSKEITIKLKGIASKLKVEDHVAVSEMLADAMKLLWEEFLHSSPGA